MPTPITVYATVAEMDSAINASALAGVALAVKQRALQDASGMMDSYFKQQLVLPFSAVGPLVRRHCINIAIFLALGGRGYNPEGDNGFVEKMYDGAISWCKEVAKGTATADVTDSREAVAGVPHTAPVVISSSQRGFTGDRGSSSRLPFQGD